MQITEQQLEAKIGTDALTTICETIGEMMWYRDYDPEIPEGNDGHVYLSERIMMNACNYLGNGCFWWGGTEYSFEAEIGDWNGFVFRKLSEDEPIAEIDYKSTKYVPVPISADGNLSPKQARTILAKWNAALRRGDIVEAVNNWMYDKTFAPGSKTSSHYREKFARLGIYAADEQEAAAVRKSLNKIARS